jgi:hypothetical protein
MSPQLERQLIEMGILPSSPLEAISVVCHRQPDRHMRMAKGFYDDPRDGNGEVNF